MGFLEVIYEILIEPEKGFNEVLNYKKPLLLSLIVVSISLFCQNIAKLLQNEEITVRGITNTLIYGYIFKLLTFTFFWIIITSIFHFIVSWKKEGKLINLFILFGTSLLPYIFLPAAAIIGIAFGVPGGKIYRILNLIIVFWVLALQIKSLKTVYTLETGKAISVYITPFFSIIVFFIISLVLIIILAANYLTNLNLPNL